MLEVILSITILHLLLFFVYQRRRNKPEMVFSYVTMCLRDEENPKTNQHLLDRFCSFRFFPRVGDTLSLEDDFLEVTEIIHEKDKSITVWCDKNLPQDAIDYFIEDRLMNGWRSSSDNPNLREKLDRRRKIQRNPSKI